MNRITLRNYILEKENRKITMEEYMKKRLDIENKKRRRSKYIEIENDLYKKVVELGKEYDKFVKMMEDEHLIKESNNEVYKHLKRTLRRYLTYYTKHCYAGNYLEYKGMMDTFRYTCIRVMSERYRKDNVLDKK